MVDALKLSLNGKRTVLSSFDDFLAMEEDRPIVEVPVPEWNDKIVLMRAMSAQDRDVWEFRFIKDQHIEPDQQKAWERDRKVKYGDRLIGMKAQLVAHCVVDERGERIFTDQQAALLQSKNAAAINRLATKANELCGFTEADTKALEEARKNSNKTHDDEPPSD